MLVHGLGRSLLDDAPLVHDADPVSHGKGFLLVVGDVQRRHSARRRMARSSFINSSRKAGRASRGARPASTGAGEAPGCAPGQRAAARRPIDRRRAAARSRQSDQIQRLSHARLDLRRDRACIRNPNATLATTFRWGKRA